MNRIKELRIARKLNQSQLAEIIGIAQPTLSGWETGRTQIDYDNLIKLANFFDTTIDYLLGLPVDLASKLPPQYLDANTSYLDKTLVLAPRAATLSGKILSSKDNKKIELTLDVLERIITMNDEQLEALAVFLRTIK